MSSNFLLLSVKKVVLYHNKFILKLRPYNQGEEECEIQSKEKIMDEEEKLDYSKALVSKDTQRGSLLPYQFAVYPFIFRFSVHYVLF